MYLWPLQPERGRAVRGERGAALIYVIAVIASLAVVIQLFAVGRMQTQIEETRRVQVREMKIHLLNSLFEIVREEMTLRNSRIDVNNIIVTCLGSGGGCDERQTDDFVIYSPSPPYIFSGEWPPPPTGLKALVGGMTGNKQFYNVGGGRCMEPVTEMTTTCPLQAIGRIRPLCGGTLDAPALSTNGGDVCAGAANGFEIIVGVASYWNGQTYYNPDFVAGDQRMFRVSARTFLY